MSNGDDVLDNWEEIDEAGLTNTLQKIQAERQTQQGITLTKSSSYSTVASAAGYNSYCNNSNNSTSAACNNLNADFQPMKLLQRTSSTPDTNSSAAVAAALKSPLDDMAATFEPVMMVLHKTNDEYQSANYTQPTNLQTVKILRRPTQSSEPRNNGMRPRQPIKTLQQREQEYAEARLRILGSAKNPEDDVSASNANSTTTITTTSSSTSTVSTPPTTATTTIAPTVTATIAAATNKVNSLPKIPLQQQQQPQAQQQQLLPQQQQQQVPSGQNVYNNHYHQQQLQQQQLQQQQQQNYYYFQQQQQQLLSSPAYNNRTLITPMSSQQQQQQQMQQLPIQQQQQQQQTWSPVVGGSVSSPALRQQQQESILRMPRGPDGSNGFQVRR